MLKPLGKSKLQRLHMRWLGPRRDADGLSESAQLWMVKVHPHEIAKIRRPSLRVQLAAVSQDGSAIEHIIDPPVQVQLKALCTEGGINYFPRGLNNGLYDHKALAKACPALIEAVKRIDALGLIPQEGEIATPLIVAHFRQAIEGAPPADEQVQMPSFD